MMWGDNTIGDTVSSVEVVQDEVALMQAARDDLPCFAPVYERYFPRIYAYCQRRVQTAEEAEDLTSHIFIQALKGLPQYRGGSVAAWLFRIAHNTLANHYRSQRTALSLEEMASDIPDKQPSPSESTIQAEDHQTIRTLIARLPDSEQELLALKINAGLTSEEIGAVLGKKPGTVRVTLHRIIKQLREMYQEEHG